MGRGVAVVSPVAPTLSRGTQTQIMPKSSRKGYRKSLKALGFFPFTTAAARRRSDGWRRINGESLSGIKTVVSRPFCSTIA